MPIGSIAGGLIGQGGANAAASGISNAASNANFQMMQQRKENRSDFSPWTETGKQAVTQIGQLLGFGRGTHPAGDGTTFQYEADPNAQANALKNLRGYTDASGATQPIYRAATPIYTTPATFTADPGYNFRQTEGQKALERSSSARGKTLSGEQFKALSDFNSGLASQEYGNWWNRYLDENRYNTAINQQNFGQQQQLFQNQYGQWRDALGDMFAAAGMGQGATNSLSGQNSGLSTAGGNAMLQGAKYAGDATMAGANALASGIGAGINNAMTMGWMGFNPTSGFFRGGGGKSSFNTRGSNPLSWEV